MRPLPARTLCECVPVGTSRVASGRGEAGSLTSTSVVPWGAFMCAMYATHPSTTTWPPPGQSKYATWRRPSALARGTSLMRTGLAQVVELDHVLRRDLAPHALRQHAQVLLDELPRIGPEAVGMRIVRAPDDVVLTHEGNDGLHVHILLVGRVALALEVVAGLHLEAEGAPTILVLGVEPVEDVGQPRHSRFAEDELEVRVLLAGPGGDERHEHLHGIELEEGGAHEAPLDHVLLLHLRGVGRAQPLEARGVEGNWEVTLRRRVPQRIPVMVIEGQAHALEGEIPAPEAHLGAAAHFGGGHDRVIVGNDGEGEDPIGIGALGEIRRPVVVDLVRPRPLVAGGNEIVDHEAAVDNLSLHPVAVEIGQPQLGRGRSRLGTPAVIPFEAVVLHLVDVTEASLLVLEEARADAVPHPLVLRVHEPVEPIFELFHPGYEQLPLGRRLRRPEIGGTVGQVDVVVPGDESLGHGTLLGVGRQESRRTRRRCQKLSLRKSRAAGSSPRPTARAEARLSEDVRPTRSRRWPPSAQQGPRFDGRPSLSGPREPALRGADSPRRGPARPRALPGGSWQCASHARPSRGSAPPSARPARDSPCAWARLARDRAGWRGSRLCGRGAGRSSADRTCRGRTGGASGRRYAGGRGHPGAPPPRGRAAPPPPSRPW